VAKSKSQLQFQLYTCIANWSWAQCSPSWKCLW